MVKRFDSMKCVFRSSGVRLYFIREQTHKSSLLKLSRYSNWFLAAHRWVCLVRAERRMNNRSSPQTLPSFCPSLFFFPAYEMDTVQTRMQVDVISESLWLTFRFIRCLQRRHKALFSAPRSAAHVQKQEISTKIRQILAAKLDCLYNQFLFKSWCRLSERGWFNHGGIEHWRTAREMLTKHIQPLWHPVEVLIWYLMRLLLSFPFPAWYHKRYSHELCSKW